MTLDLKTACRSKKFTRNFGGRDLFVGDLHGEVETLFSALFALDFDFSKDRLFATGDLIDRGPDSLRATQLLAEPWFHSVLGNHEQLLLDYRDDSILRQARWYQNGGEWWDSVSISERSNVVELLCTNLYFSIEVDVGSSKVGVVHADIPESVEWKALIESSNNVTQEELRYCLWSRNLVKTLKPRTISGVDYLITGHTPIKSPLQLGNIVLLDTGSGYQPSNQVPNPSLSFFELKEGIPSVFSFHKRLGLKEVLLNKQ